MLQRCSPITNVELSRLVDVLAGVRSGRRASGLGRSLCLGLARLLRRSFVPGRGVRLAVMNVDGC